MKVKIIKNKTSSRIDILGRSISPQSILLTNVTISDKILTILNKNYKTHYHAEMLIVANKRDIVKERDFKEDSDIVKVDKEKSEPKKKQAPKRRASKSVSSQTKKKKEE